MKEPTYLTTQPSTVRSPRFNFNPLFVWEPTWNHPTQRVFNTSQRWPKGPGLQAPRAKALILLRSLLIQDRTSLPP
jgi:hypothetical protein